MKTVIEMAREAGFATSWTEAAGEALERFAALVRADEREAFVAKIQAEIDHAHLNELRLTPSFGKRQGEIAVHASSLDAALDAIRARGQA